MWTQKDSDSMNGCASPWCDMVSIGFPLCYCVPFCGNHRISGSLISLSTCSEQTFLTSETNEEIFILQRGTVRQWCSVRRGIRWWKLWIFSPYFALFWFWWMNELVKYCYYECFGWDYHDKMIAYKTHHIHLRPFIFTLIQIKSTSCIFNTIIVQNRIEATRSMLYHICLFVHKIRNTNRTSHRYVMSQRFHLGLWMS